MNASRSKLMSGYVLGGLALFYTVYAGNSIGTDAASRTLNVLLCVAGGVFGWIRRDAHHATGGRKEGLFEGRRGFNDLRYGLLAREVRADFRC